MIFVKGEYLLEEHFRFPVQHVDYTDFSLVLIPPLISPESVSMEVSLMMLKHHNRLFEY